MTLNLRPLEARDAAPTAAMITPEISRWTGSWPTSVTIDEVAARIERMHADEAAGLRIERAMVDADDRLMGWVGVVRPDPQLRTASLGYWLGEPFHGHGYTTQAAVRLLQLAWATWDLDLIEAMVQPANAASKGVVRKLGMRQIGDRTTFPIARNRLEVCNAFALTRADFDSRPGVT